MEATLPRETTDAGCAALARYAELRRIAFLTAAGCCALAVGVLVYLTDRDPAWARLLPMVGARAGNAAFGVLGQWLPSFVHVFAFGLFTAAALPLRRTPRYEVCAVWCVVNVALELGQHPQLSARLAEALEGGFGRTPLIRQLAGYFVRGTFDVGDVVAAVLGALMAAAVLRLTYRRWEVPHAQ